MRKKVTKPKRTFAPSSFILFAYYCRLLLSSVLAFNPVRAFMLRRRTATVTTQNSNLHHRHMLSTPPPPTPTPVEDVDGIVNTTAAKADEWKGLPLRKKIEILHQIRENAFLYREECESLLLQSRGVSSAMASQDERRWGYALIDSTVTGIFTLANYISGLIDSLEGMEQNEGKPISPVGCRKTSMGKRVATVFPNGPLESLLAFGLKGELVLGKAEEEGRMQYSNIEEVAEGGVVGVLGAGNFDAPIELLTEMFIKSKVCIYKSNPANALTDPVHIKIFEPLITPKYLSFISGGAAVGSALTTHPSLTSVSLTGSSSTLQKVKWGSTEAEQTLNRMASKPLVKIPICAELGAVTPWIVVPGKQWNSKTVDRHARAVAFAKMANNGYVCVSPQLLIVGENWEYRNEFLERVKYWLGKHPGGASFYPGSGESYEFFGSLPGAQVVKPTGEEEDGRQYPIVIPNVKANDDKLNVTLRREAWCPILVEVALPYGKPSPTSTQPANEDPIQFLRSAFRFTKENVVGSLSTCILIDDHTVKTNAEQFDDIVASIPYGIVGVNIFPAYAHSMSKLTWGAFPGYEVSGKGIIGNAYLYRQPEKMVLRAPFMYIGRKALEVMDPRKHYLVSSRFTTYALRPGYVNLTKMFMALFLGV